MKSRIKSFDLAQMIEEARLGILGHEGQGGINDSRDVLVTQTTDGVDYNSLWAEFQQVVALRNADRNRVIDLLTFQVTTPQESVTQLSSADFEESTEYGEPRGMRQQPTAWNMGYGFQWYDVAQRFTWQFLAEANAAQVTAMQSAVLDGHNRKTYEKVLEALYSPENRIASIQGQPVNVYALYNGDGTVPPAYKSNVFTGTESHYMTSGANRVEPGDLDDLHEKMRGKGNGKENGVQLIVFVNSREGKDIRKFRIDNGATYDFIPAIGQAGDRVLELGQSVSGGRPPSTIKGFNVIGAYGDLLIVEDDLFVPGYVLIIGTGGTNNLANPVGIREHAQASLRGLRLIKGRDAAYPLIDSFYHFGFGTGIRQRGGAAIMKITTNAQYTAPSAFIY
jgi:hypothetical protein